MPEPPVTGPERGRTIPRMVLITMAAALCAAAAIGMAVLLSGASASDYTAEQGAYSAVTLLVFGAAAAAGIAIMNGSRATLLGWLCFAVALAGAAVTMMMIWTTGEGEEAATGLVKASGSLFVAAVALADICLLSRRRDRDGSLGRAVALFTTVAALVLAALLVIAILAEVSGDVYFRWVGAAAIAWVLGTALVPIGRRLRQPA
jgi:hypothetical protein